MSYLGSLGLMIPMKDNKYADLQVQLLSVMKNVNLQNCWLDLDVFTEIIMNKFDYQ